MIENLAAATTNDPAASPTPHGNEYMLYVFKPFWSLLIKGGEAYEVDSLQAGPYGRVLYILLRAYNSRFATFGSLSCNT